MSPLLPAEKTHYRKGLALGLTMAETFSIVVFILLLACAALLRFEQVQRTSAEAQRDTARVDLVITQEMVRADDMSWGNADAWFERSRELVRQVEAERRRAEVAERDLATAQAHASEVERQLEGAGTPAEVAARLGEQAAEIETLKDSLNHSVAARDEAVARKDSLERQTAALADSLEERGAVAELLEELEVAGPAPEDPTRDPAEQLIERAARTERLEDSLALTRGVVSALDQEVRAIRRAMGTDSAAVLDSLRSEVVDARLRLEALGDRTARAERERDDAIGRATYLATQVDQLRGGMGIDPPPCWLDRDGDPEYLFRIELTNGGMRLHDIAPAHRVQGAQADLEAVNHVAAIEEGREYDPAAFLRLTLPFYQIGVSRTESFGDLGCRFWVRPVDMTGDSKEIFQERESQLWRRFWFRW